MPKSISGNHQEPWQITQGQKPVAATAIHNGHDLRAEVAEIMTLAEADRLREEDPYTGIWTSVAPTRIVCFRSRFEMDLNRPRERAIYRKPEDAWGLEMWKQEPPPDLVERSLAQYDRFYEEVHGVFSEMERRFGHFVVLDLHSYNHRRDGADGPPADPEANPEVNVGTGTLNRDPWGPLVDRFMGDLREFRFLGKHLDVRENVRFRGGHFSKWIHENFPESACCLAIEFKKFFMDEWTGEISPEEFEAVPQALEAAVAGLQESMVKVGS